MARRCVSELPVQVDQTPLRLFSFSGFWKETTVNCVQAEPTSPHPFSLTAAQWQVSASMPGGGSAAWDCAVKAGCPSREGPWKVGKCGEGERSLQLLGNGTWRPARAARCSAWSTPSEAPGEHSILNSLKLTREVPQKTLRQKSGASQHSSMFSSICLLSIDQPSRASVCLTSATSCSSSGNYVHCSPPPIDLHVHLQEHLFQHVLCQRRPSALFAFASCPL
ncbi:uncharacterized protein LOC129181106 [Dunckerocampus dactyliophorus]|uniref:uncharacterized protein LOC129181106 n=1 Tax=Dunckerocampus dactyliophorus TaxID=161453 RepID=UPI0024070E03|nr:uncharacterized protein LOC129181106 [Dunckerocampus dactyliophorus]